MRDAAGRKAVSLLRVMIGAVALLSLWRMNCGDVCAGGDLYHGKPGVEGSRSGANHDVEK